MGFWAEKSEEFKRMLRLKNEPIAFRRLERAEDLNNISDVIRVKRNFNYCQVPFLVRVLGQTVGITKDDPILGRCARLHGLREATEKSMKAEAAMLSTTWFASADDALAQQRETPRVPMAGAIVISPLSEEKFEPDVVMIYANPAQIMMILCGLQKERYERFSFSFIGEGACADSLAQCYASGKPSVAIPCYGERMLGQVADDEIVIAIPPGEIIRAVSGIKKLYHIGFTYPIRYTGGLLDPGPVLSQYYPPREEK